ncbi:hypothetical protein [Desulfofundulus thermosubterraneus]|uniref:4-amino-4-deoxy-L-arabinose transferase n=1 Tax=Desulfofundulus thermosubterraneus DSM 16057 TaxID=1121432 RepID=A0A1M6FTS1_9FIRM|nr:hypothetical protein [Desulfofundulus thermosubterraneus]SHJ01087.1 hypothetical protein SAMN02745219_01547 [Desulfofundulus thermosubterraneus DSM 16057]
MWEAKRTRTNWKAIAVFMLALAFVLFLHGAVPFVAVPTLGQAVAATGYSQSFVNESLFSIYAKNFGLPDPAPALCGLVVLYPAGFLIAAGLHPADAYAAMAALWLAVSFFGAWRIGLMFGLRAPLAAVGAVLWMSMPVVWAHACYSMLSLGIGLLSFYFWAALRIFTLLPTDRVDAICSAALYVAVCLIAIFMDGYSFMMFAVGSSLLAAYVFIRFAERRRHLLVFAFPLHVVGLGLAYALYAVYVGKPQFEPAPLDFFRGWGVDLTFLAIPTKGMHWLWDALGLSMPRSDREFFGDASVWMTTFSIPVILVGLVAWWCTRRKTKLAAGFLLVALFGFYMSLGPSLKVNSVKPHEMGPLMPAELAVAPTGSAWLSENLPGFKNMRAAYRWSALGVFGFWALIVLLIARMDRRAQVWGFALLSLLIVSNLPLPEKQWIEKVNNREMFFRIDADLVDDMKKVLYQGELVAFLPYRNDFLVNYLASRLNIRTYNIGGDKNLVEARKHWPLTMRTFQMGRVNSGFSNRVLLLLVRREADTVVLPYIDMLWAAHAWPAPLKYKQELESIIRELAKSGYVHIEEREHYAIVRLSSKYVQSSSLYNLERDILKIHVFRFDESNTLTQVGILKEGRLVSDGRAGFLLFGPYSPVKAGEYRLVVKGSASAVDSAWVDVVSQKGTVQHAKFPLAVTTEGISGVLADGLVRLEAPVDDLEVRVYVGAQDRVQLEGYELTPVEAGRER